MKVFTIDEKYLVDVDVKYGYTDSINNFYTTQYSVDHPAFDALRNLLENRNFIKMDDKCWNGDVVLKTFQLNNHIFKPGDKFRCASAIKFDLERSPNGREAVC